MRRCPRLATPTRTSSSLFIAFINRSSVRSSPYLPQTDQPPTLLDLLRLRRTLQSPVQPSSGLPGNTYRKILCCRLHRPGAHRPRQQNATIHSSKYHRVLRRSFSTPTVGNLSVDMLSSSPAPAWPQTPLQTLADISIGSGPMIVDPFTGMAFYTSHTLPTISLCPTPMPRPMIALHAQR